MAQPNDEPSSWRSEHIALVAATLTIASPVVFIVFGWIAGAAVAALAASAAVVVALSVRLERGELERRMHIAEQAASAERDAKGRFLSVLSHDLRQPLHAMSLYTAALNKRVDNAEARAIVEKIERAAQVSAALIGRVDEHVQSTKAALDPQFETVALEPLFAAVNDAYPSVHTTNTSAHVRTDPNLLRDLLGRLAENAVRHGGGGRIEVSGDDEEIEVSIVDAGPGVAPEDQARIFEEFVRLENATRGQGMGLGLAIAKRIAESLSADLRVNSNPGEGARFSIRLPRVS